MFFNPSGCKKACFQTQLQKSLFPEEDWNTYSKFDTWYPDHLDRHTLIPILVPTSNLPLIHWNISPAASSWAKQFTDSIPPFTCVRLKKNLKLKAEMAAMCTMCLCCPCLCRTPPAAENMWNESPKYWLTFSFHYKLEKLSKVRWDSLVKNNVLLTNFCQVCVDFTKFFENNLGDF